MKVFDNDSKGFYVQCEKKEKVGLIARLSFTEKTNNDSSEIPAQYPEETITLPEKSEPGTETTINVLKSSPGYDQLKTVFQYVSKEESRYTLNSLWIEHGNIHASNGKVAIVMRIAGLEKLENGIYDKTVSPKIITLTKRLNPDNVKYPPLYKLIPEKAFFVKHLLGISKKACKDTKSCFLGVFLYFCSRIVAINPDFLEPLSTINPNNGFKIYHQNNPKLPVIITGDNFVFLVQGIIPDKY